MRNAVVVFVTLSGLRREKLPTKSNASNVGGFFLGLDDDRFSTRTTTNAKRTAQLRRGAACCVLAVPLCAHIYGRGPLAISLKSGGKA